MEILGLIFILAFSYLILKCWTRVLEFLLGAVALAGILGLLVCCFYTMIAPFLAYSSYMAGEPWLHGLGWLLLYWVASFTALAFMLPASALQEYNDKKHGRLP